MPFSQSSHLKQALENTRRCEDEKIDTKYNHPDDFQCSRNEAKFITYRISENWANYESRNFCKCSSFIARIMHGVIEKNVLETFPTIT